MTIIHQPHDALFKSYLTDLSKARNLLERYLPAKIKSICDFTTLKFESGSFIDKRLKKHFSDILHSIQIRGKKAYIYTLIEHLTNPDRLVPFKFLRYQILVMQQHLDNSHDQLPIVVPILFYRGNVSPYPYSLNLFDCYDEEDQELAKEIFLQPLLVDITVIADEELRTHGSIALLEILQKNIHRRDAMEFVKDIFTSVAQQFLTDEQFKKVLYYISQEGESKDFKGFYSSLSKALPNFREDIMTLAQQLKQEGLQQGLQRGEYNKAIAIAKNMLAMGANRDFTKKATGLSDQDLLALEE